MKYYALYVWNHKYKDYRTYTYYYAAQSKESLINAIESEIPIADIYRRLIKIRENPPANYHEYLQTTLDFVVNKSHYIRDFICYAYGDKWYTIEEIKLKVVEETPKISNRVADIRKWILENEYKGIQCTNKKAIKGSFAIKTYEEHGVEIYYNMYWNYLEILGLSEEEYYSLSDILEVLDLS